MHHPLQSAEANTVACEPQHEAPWSKPLKRLLMTTAALALLTTAAQAEIQPHYITPTGPTKVVQYGTVGCLAFEDFLEVAGNQIAGMSVDVDGLIKARRCFNMPVGTSVEVVERGRTPASMGGEDTNWICVKPTGLTRSGCVWLLIQQLDVRAD